MIPDFSLAAAVFGGCASRLRCHIDQRLRNPEKKAEHKPLRRSRNG